MAAIYPTRRLTPIPGVGTTAGRCRAKMGVQPWGGAVTGTEHYNEATRLLGEADSARSELTEGRKTEKELELEMRAIELTLASAQVHAQLASCPSTD
jgi:hypothetical protein